MWTWDRGYRSTVLASSVARPPSFYPSQLSSPPLSSSLSLLCEEGGFPWRGRKEDKEEREGSKRKKKRGVNSSFVSNVVVVGGGGRIGGAKKKKKKKKKQKKPSQLIGKEVEGISAAIRGKHGKPQAGAETHPDTDTELGREREGRENPVFLLPISSSSSSLSLHWFQWGREREKERERPPTDVGGLNMQGDQTQLRLCRATFLLDATSPIPRANIGREGRSRELCV